MRWGFSLKKLCPVIVIGLIFEVRNALIFEVRRKNSYFLRFWAKKIPVSGDSRGDDVGIFVPEVQNSDGSYGRFNVHAIGEDGL